MAELQGLMDSFHEKDFVYGDWWDASIICKNDSVMLIDFDVVSYRRVGCLMT